MDIIAEARKMRPILEQIMQNTDDRKASKCVCFLPHWSQLIGKTVEKDFKFQHNGKPYAVNQPNHTFMAHWEPGPGMESLYREIPEWFAGDEYDPIPYSGNMALESGKYYTEDGVMYKCIRDSVYAVHDKLSVLATVQGGEYVKKVN